MKFLAEDPPHKSLLRSLGIPRKKILLLGPKGNVIKKLKNLPDYIGMVDEDPHSIQTQSHELANYQEIANDMGLRLLLNKHGNKKIIILCPKIEDWLLQRAKSSNIDLKHYYLPNNSKELKKITNYDSKDGFKRFLSELKEKDKGMKLLQEWLFQKTT